MNFTAKKKRRIILLSLLSVAIVSVIISLLVSNVYFKETKYNLQNEKLNSSMKIAVIADLHNYEYGSNNQRLIEKIDNMNPDAVFMVGDLINDDEENISVALNLIEALSKSYPVYCSYGNQEYNYDIIHSENIKSQWEKAGATVVEKDYIDTEINGNKVRIGGIFGYCLPYIADGKHQYKWYESETEYLNDFTNTNRIKILLCHMPVCFIINGSLDYWNIDYVFSGHAHGGQIKLPFVGAVYAPDQGFFPGKEQGIFTSSNGEHTMILCAGLGSTLPRVNNIPELVEVKISGK